MLRRLPTPAKIFVEGSFDRQCAIALLGTGEGMNLNVMYELEAYRNALREKISDLQGKLIIIEDPEAHLHPSLLATITASKLLFPSPTVKASKVAKMRRTITRLVRQLWEAAAAVHSQIVVRKKGTQQSASRGRGQGIRTWVPAVFESDLSSALPTNLNVLSMPKTRGVLVVRTSSSAAVRREQLRATPVASQKRAQSRQTLHPTLA